MMPHAKDAKDAKEEGAGPSVSFRLGTTPIELTALAPDVLRLRVTSPVGRDSVEPPIERSEASAASISGEVTSTRDARSARASCVGNWGSTESHPTGRVALTTAAGKFSLNRRTGAWTLHDHTGLEVFRCSDFSLADAQPQLTLQLAEGERIFGLGESTGPLNKRGLIREFWNADVLGQSSCIHPSLRNLYVSIPFALSLREGRAAGLFWDNPARQTWDIGCTQPDEFRLRATTGPLDLYLFLGSAG